MVVHLRGSLVAPIHIHTTLWMVVVRILEGSIVVMHLVEKMVGMVVLLCMVSDVDGGDAVFGSNALDGRRWDKYFCFPQVACGRHLWGGG